MGGRSETVPFSDEEQLHDQLQRDWMEGHTELLIAMGMRRHGLDIS
jgi:hypothetical protein